MFQGNSETYYLTESGLTEIWQQLPGRTDLATEEGEPIEIIYPGRCNDDRGPDLRDTVVATRHGLLSGDVEIHTRSSSWWTHQHHLDPHYNQVILHVVFRADTEAATNLQNGRVVPTLALHKFMNGLASSTANSSMPCHNLLAHLDSGLLGLFLDNAGRERFFTKAARFEAELARIEASQTLYQGIMGALGYNKNKPPFLELARRLPIQLLETVAQGEKSGTEYLAHQQALLLGTAGLLPSQCSKLSPGKLNDEWLDKLERLWGSYQITEAMAENDWQLFKVRPNNSPARRIVAMSYLLLRYRNEGILQALIEKLRTTPLHICHRELEKALLVITNGYWANHLSAGMPSRLINPTLLGSQRAAEIAVNIILPFISAWGRLNSQQALAKKALKLYSGYPRLAVNAVERHMKHQLGISNDSVNSAQRQQGLVHIYRTMCSQGKCTCCPISATGAR